MIYLYKTTDSVEGFNPRPGSRIFRDKFSPIPPLAGRAVEKLIDFDPAKTIPIRMQKKYQIFCLNFLSFLPSFLRAGQSGGHGMMANPLNYESPLFLKGFFYGNDSTAALFEQ